MKNLKISLPDVSLCLSKRISLRRSWAFLDRKNTLRMTLSAVKTYKKAVPLLSKKEIYCCILATD